MDRKQLEKLKEKALTFFMKDWEHGIDCSKEFRIPKNITVSQAQKLASGVSQRLPYVNGIICYVASNESQPVLTYRKTYC